MGVRVDLTAAVVANATGGRVTGGDPATRFDGVSTDTRRLTAGALFIALPGDRFDAHEFVGQAVAAGATGVVVSREVDARDAAVILVEDTLAALQALGHFVRRASGARVVAITGSAGKTTTREITASLIEAGGARVHRTEQNYNNHIGLPLTLVGMARGCDVAVVELGMNHAGEIRRLVEIAEPDVRVWTNVGDAHIGHFGSREAVALAKAEVLEPTPTPAVIVANIDDPLVSRHVQASAMRHVTFGEHASADVRATNIVDRGYDGLAARILTPTGEAEIAVRLPGRFNLLNILAAVGAAGECDVPLDVMTAALASITPVRRRGSSLHLATGVRVVDDSYNASPAALESAIATLAATPVIGRRILVAGEMLELGDESARLHEACGRAAARAGLDLVVAIGGPVMDRFVRGLEEGGLPSDRVLRFDDSAAAAEALPARLRRGDLVLVKGSHGTRTDVVVDHLEAVA